MLYTTGCKTKPTISPIDSQSTSDSTISNDSISGSTDSNSEPETSTGTSEDITSDMSLESGASSNTDSGSTASNSKNSSTTSSSTSSQPDIGIQYKDPVLNLKGRTITIAQNLASTVADLYNTVYGKKLKAKIEAIQLKYNCKIVIEKMDYLALNTSILAGDPICDIMDGGGPHLTAGYMNADLLLPLDNFQYINFNDARFDSFVTQSLYFKGKHYGVLPKAQAFDSLSFGQVLYFNKSLLQRSGITEDLYTLQKNGQWTWAKLEEISKKVTNKNAGIWGIGDNQYWMYMNLVTSNKTDWVKRVSGAVKFTAGETNALEALNFYKKLSWDDKSMRVMADINSDRMIDQNEFWAGKVAFMPDYLERIQRGYPKMKDDFGVLFIPKGPKAQDYASGVNWYSYFSIPRTVKNANEVATILYEYCKPTLTTKEDSSILKVQLASFVRDQGSLDTINQLQSKMVRSYIFDAWPLHWTPDGWYPLLSQIAYNQITPNTAVKQSTDAFNKKIEDYNAYLR
jgi:hypothetical protein